MIDRETLAQIILDFQKAKLPELIPRELELNMEIPIKRAVVILGPRRCGKTYYLYFLIKKLLEKGIKKERILYINFEDPKLYGMELKDLINLLDLFYEIYPQNKNKRVWFFFDEIQNAENWELFIRNILDKEKVYLFLCGSSSKFLSKDVATSLRGRTLSYLILPFSFAEFLKAKNIILKKYLSSEEKFRLLNAFREYFNFGSYPEIVIFPEEREKIIQEIVEVTIYRDLIERCKVRNIKVVKLMFNYLVKAKEFSINKFYNFLKSLNIKVSKNSLYNYLDFFNDAFIFFPLRKFSYSLKEIEQSIPKIYTVDNGIIENIAGNERGKKLENLIFISLLRKGYEPNKNIFYFKLNNNEVDFVVKKRERFLYLIQSCFNINDYQTKEREIKALIKASHLLKCNNLIIITFDYEAEEKTENKRIKYIPVWKWLLSGSRMSSN